MSPRSNMKWVWLLGAMFACAGPATPGCAVERDPINRVQPDYVRKTDLIPSQFAAIQRAGESWRDRSHAPTLNPNVIRDEAQWYHQITVLDKPATTGAAGVTSYTQVERIYWEVTENLLIARQAYERLQDGQGGSSTGDGVRQQEIVAAYHITSHFDIRSDYNATTGEPNNVLVENDEDRPWYKRDFMRVDWSKNLVGTFTPITSVAWGTMQAEAQDYVSSPDDPNRPLFDYGAFEGAQNTLRYFDVTNRMILHPETVNLGGSTGTVPACLLYDRITESCEPADVLLRVSFRRVEPSRDYAPQLLDGHRMERFGFFEDVRNGFSRQVGTPGQLERRHFANRHNLWMQHHAKPAGNALDHKPGDHACQADSDCRDVSATAKCDGASRTCGEVYLRCAPTARTSDEAARQRDADMACASVGPGARCDLDVATLRGDRLGLCLLPFRQRTVRPLTYHLSPNYPARMMPVTNQIMSEWRRVFNDTVRQARYRECLLDRASPNSGTPAACERWRNPNAPETADARAVWTACHNPVWGADASKPGAHTAAEVEAARAAGWDLDACGPQGTSARLGDTRYSMLASVNEYDAQGPWGLAMITGDPSTGEVLAGRGAVWLTVTESQTNFATDMIRILNREVTPERFALGQTVFDAYDYVRSLGGHDAASGSNVPYTPRPVHRDYSSAEEIQTVLAATTFDQARTLPADAPIDNEALRRFSRDAVSGEANDYVMLRNALTAYRNELPHTNPEDAAARLGRLRGTAIEAQVVDREMLLGQEINPDLRTEQAVELASPFRQNGMAHRQAAEQWRRVMQEHECRADAQFSDEVIAVMLHRFRKNEVPADVRFGRSDWNFHAANAPAVCPDEVDVNADGSSNCPLNYEEVYNYLLQYIHYGVTLHELGHSVGERHNFMGSSDAFNYPDRYWPLRRTAGTRPGEAVPPASSVRPRWEHQARGLPFYSPQEEQGGVEEYAYSTVMDYVGWNQDAHGLGRYDRAFVLHGYVDMVEAFDQVDNPGEALMMAENWAGGYQSAVRVQYLGDQTTASPVTYHYTDIPRVVGLDAQGNPRLGDDNRYPVFLSETRRENYGAFNWTPDHTNTTAAGRDGRDGGSHVLVPYSFGTDDWANGVWNTQRYDAGADIYESMRYVAVRYMDYYFANAFARNRATFTRDGYRARMTSRYLDQMYYSLRSVQYILSIYESILGGQAAWRTLLAPTSTSSFARTIQGSRLGVAMVADAFANSVLMPEASPLNEFGGLHCLSTRNDGTQIYVRANGGTNCVNIPVGAGRAFASSYDWGSGFFWRDRLLGVGSYHDKQLGLEYMTDTFQWIPGRYLIEFDDVHRLQINFYTLYPGPTLRFFGSLLARDYDDIAPQARPRVGGGEPEIFRTQFARLNLPFGAGAGTNGRSNGNARAVSPNLGFTLELDALAYLRGQLELTFDRTARVSALLWREGDHWALPDTGDRDLVTFVNPFTNVRYQAVHIGGRDGEPGAVTGLSRRDESSNETGIAARMLIHANRLREVRERTPVAQRANIDNELHGYIDLVDALRDLAHQYN